MTRRIPLTQGKYAIVDDRDYPALSNHKWCAKQSASKWYAVRGVWTGSGVKIVRMHREIMNCPLGKEVHHRDTNGLNNKRRNLKISTKRENLNYRECD